MIEMLGLFVAEILRRIKKGDFQEATLLIDHAYQDLLKRNVIFFDKIPLRNLTDSLIQEYNYTNGHLEILSELFYTQAELNYAQNNQDESLKYYQKSLHLLNFVIEESKTFNFDKQTKLSHMRNRIAELEI
ncbi:MAG TPA: hypothetical protein VKY45_03965 [Marinilabiliaceae bacterium]|nr:hypothetical protein [Marinilabiliaceae bacterium]